MVSPIDPLLHALHRPAGLPWLSDIARRFDALAEQGKAPAAAEYADMLHGIVGVGQLLSLAIAELQAERAHIDRRGEQLAAREAQLAAHIAEIESAAEELRALIAIADARIAALKRLTDR